jgi:cell division protein FtsB
MPTNPDAKSLSLKRNKGNSKPTSDSTNTIQDGDTASSTSTAAHTQQTLLADQLKVMLTSDSSLLNTLAETIASILVNSADLLEQVTQKLKSSLKEDITQHVYQSVSMDIEQQTNVTSRLQQEQAALTSKISTLEDKLDDYEQYSRNNCLLIHGLPEKSKENTNKTAINTIQTHLKLSLSDEDIDRSHRLGRKQTADTSDEHDRRPRSRPIILKFCSYAKREMVFKIKSKLKGTGIVITENLTAKRMGLLTATKKHEAVASAWSTDGRIQCITTSDEYVNIKNARDLDDLE